MPNRAKHLGLGQVTGKIVSVFKKKRPLVDEFLEEIGAELTRPTLSMLPDIIEPATSPNHRKLAHSIPALVTSVVISTQSGKAADKIHSWGDAAANKANRAQGRLSKVGWKALEYSSRIAAGVTRHAAPQYATHLVADAMTPKGLPWK